MKSKSVLVLALLVLAAGFLPQPAFSDDLPDIKARGSLRHLGIPYANFVSSQGDGMDAEIIKAFAGHLGVRYEYVLTDWLTAVPDLIGKTFTVQGTEVEITGDAPIRGDLLANGLTILPWRLNILSYSVPTFPTQVWLVVKSDSPVTPIAPTGDIQKDIALTRAKLKGMAILCKSGTCLDPNLFDLGSTGAQARDFPGSLNDLAPAVILGEAEATLLDVPDAMIALQKYPGKIKIVGPLTAEQGMAVGFRKDQPLLREEFDRFFGRLKASGAYDAMVKKHYPLVYTYFPGFFAQAAGK